MSIDFLSENKFKILILAGVYLLITITGAIVKWWLQLRRHTEFIKGRTDSTKGKLGLLPDFKGFMTNDESFIDYRLEQEKIHGGFNAEWTPPIYIVYVSDPILAKFLLNLPSDVVEKGGFTKEMFASDIHGFQGGLLMDEGKKWSLNRKVISKLLHLEILDQYIEPMDVSG